MYDVVEYYLRETGAVDINTKNEDGSTALGMAAIFAEDVEIIQILIRYGALVNSVNDNGYSALHMAALFNPNPEVIRVLVESGAQINLQDYAGYTALHRVSPYQENPEVLDALLDAGASPFIRNNRGSLPIDLIKRNEHIAGSEAYYRLQRPTPLPGKQTAPYRGDLPPVEDYKSCKK